MVGRSPGRTVLRARVLRASVVAFLLVSAGCASSVTAPNDAAVSIENEDTVPHVVRVKISVENRTVVSNATRVGPGTERTLNGTAVPVTGADRRYRVRVRLGNGHTETTTFVEGEFDGIHVVVGPEGTIRISWVNAT